MFKYIYFTLLAILLSCSYISNNITSSSRAKSVVVNNVNDPKHPVISLIGDITPEMASAFTESVMIDKVHGANDVIIKIDSIGGSTDAGFQMESALHTSGLKSICIVDGEANSMAFYFLQTCSVREATEKSILMVHEPHFSDVSGNRYELRQYASLLDKVANSMAVVESKRMNIPIDRFNAIIQKDDWWMTAREALVANAIDKIVAKP